MINNQELLIKNIIYSCEPLFFILISLINDKLQQNTVGILYDSTKLIYCTFTLYSMWKTYGKPQKYSPQYTRNRGINNAFGAGY